MARNAWFAYLIGARQSQSLDQSASSDTLYVHSSLPYRPRNAVLQSHLSVLCGSAMVTLFLVTEAPEQLHVPCSAYCAALGHLALV